MKMLLRRLIFASCAIIIAGCDAAEPRERVEFSPDAWKNAQCFPSDPTASSGDFVAARFDMVEDLENGILQVGMTRDEVVALLGPSEAPNGNDERFTYCLGQDMIDTVGFWVIFDEDGKVESFRTVQG